MTQSGEPLSTGLPGLDRVLHGLLPGDNVIWQVESLSDYAPFVDAYCRYASQKGERLVYFRFGRHESLPPRDAEFETCQLRPDDGPEAFVTEIHQRLERAGRGAWFVFDNLSDLADAWYGDTMLANVFMLVCPYLYETEAVAYFALERNRHSRLASETVLDTAQVVIDVHRHNGGLYLHPLKVEKRHSPTMYMLHSWRGSEFLPVTASSTAAEILASTADAPAVTSPGRPDVWQEALGTARDLLAASDDGLGPDDERAAVFRRLIRMLIARDERVSRLAEKYLNLRDLVEISRRLVGTGRIGGKAVGMLIARAILAGAGERWRQALEPHDSFYVGSDVFFTFLVRNGLWWAREKQRDPQRYLDDSEEARQRILMGRFSDETMRQFQHMLDYFGQSPIIVRSSSLLEDNFGNAFSGKYDSIFCANQGSRENRLQTFLSAVRAIYASSMSEKALRYRAERGILGREEQMALLVQRVSGDVHGGFFYPHLAGVAFSHNPYVWSSDIDPKAGVLRLVFGLGTRAVDRADDDYTRLVALNAPEREPSAARDDVRSRSQRRVDVLDLRLDRWMTRDLAEVAAESADVPMTLFASLDERPARASREDAPRAAPAWRLTFARLFGETAFVADMRELLGALERAYDYPVDVEFTANFLPNGAHKINLLQCRPWPVKGEGVAPEPPSHVDAGRLLFRTHGVVVGPSRVVAIDRLIYVSPEAYGELPLRDRYAIARLVGTLTHLDTAHAPAKTLLMGPGRWGTTMPALGVPVAFGEISTVSVLCEIVAMRENLVPDVSLGTHFFNDLVENDILYLALFPNREGNSLNDALIGSLPNSLSDAVPSAAKWRHVVRLVDFGGLVGKGPVKLNANTLAEDVFCYFDSSAP